MKWIIPCNPKMYNIDKAYEESTTVFWHKNAKYTVGDEVYLYISDTVKAVRYKVVVKAIQIFMDKGYKDPYWINAKGIDEKKEYVLMEFVKKYSNDDMSRDQLILHGLKGRLMGPRKLSGDLEEFIKAQD